MPTERCGGCGGDGWNSEAAHDCNGDERVCVGRCPIEVQVRCARCGGTGRIEVPDAD